MNAPLLRLSCANPTCWRTTSSARYRHPGSYVGLGPAAARTHGVCSVHTFLHHECGLDGRRFGDRIQPLVNGKGPWLIMQHSTMVCLLRQRDTRHSR
ncbi:MAG: hypothetical protein MUC47_08820, partial [Candidatus Kapabacteria bacterium]|nr:hypothetical protein [Candidatus Kapabacteria bacterium]